MNAPLQMEQSELIAVLRNSLYPGAQEESIKLVIGYCRAVGLDPMQKPVHIVPMYVSTGQKDERGYDIKANRDVIMPGIGLYRTQAVRTGQLAGISEPEFGEDRTETLDGITITYPVWCRVTVERLLANGDRAKYSAVERWKENYATKKRDSQAPNAMWEKRPYAQLAKCAQAQALRTAFPEMTGEQATADEMAGKSEGDVIQGELVTKTTLIAQTTTTQPEPWPEDKFAEQLPKWAGLMRERKKTVEDVISFAKSKRPLTDAQIQKINDHAPATTEQIEAVRTTASDFEVVLDDVVAHVLAESLEAMTVYQARLAVEFIKSGGK